MKITLAQTKITWEAKKRNIERARQLVSEQAASGADMILFPEMSFTGFSMNTDVTKDKSLKTISVLTEIASEYRIEIGFGWVRDCGEKCENHYIILGKDGLVLSDYAKIHPFSYYDEDKYFSGGHRISTFDVSGIPFSTFICYDLRFPELFRAVVEQVHAIIIPANWPAKRSEHWKALLKARAIENQVYIFAVNCVGDMGGQYYSGDSCVINPNGDVVEMLSNKEGIIVYDLIDDVEDYRTAFPVLKDKRPEVYCKG